MSTWEERMAARAAERAERRAAAQAEIDARYPESTRWPGHDGHHAHVEGNAFICSCGDPQTIGVFTIGLDDGRFWSDEPAERAQAEREVADFQAWICCHVCGEHGVIAADVFGVWPPQAIGPSP